MAAERRPKTISVEEYFELEKKLNGKLGLTAGVA